MLSIANATAFWVPKDGKVTKLESKPPLADEVLKTSLQAKSGSFPSVTLQVLTREDAAKLNQE